MKKSKQITLLDLKNSFESSLKSNNKELTKVIQSTKEELTGLIQTNKEELTGLIKSTKEELVGKIDEVLFSVKASFNEVDDKFIKIENRLGNVEKDLSFVKSKVDTQIVSKAYLDDRLSHYKKITHSHRTPEVLAI